MFPVSAEFAEALTSGQTVVTKAEVWDAGVVTVLDVLDGNVSVDRSGAVRRRASVTLTDPTGALTPTTASDLLAPYGNELRLYRGLRLSTGDELVPLGVFGISDVDIADSDESLTISVDAYDRARKVARARLVQPYVIASGTNYATAIRDLIGSRVAGLTYSFTTTTSTTPQIVLDTGADPWAEASKMAGAIGCELFFDASGVCVLRVEPDPVTDPVVMTYSEGEDAVVLSLTRRLTDEQTYNHVIVSGEAAENVTPVRGEARDEDAASPTYYLGDFGDVPYFQVSSLVTSTAQANAAAAAMLRRQLGSTESLQMTSLVNPAHEAGDVITVTRARAKVDARFVVEQFNVPLSAQQPQNITTRRRRV